MAAAHRLGRLLLGAGAVFATSLAAAGDIPDGQRRSGYALMGRELQAMQDDATGNPGMLWVLEGDALWRRAAGAARKSCADCHGEAHASMRGVAARYPAFDAGRGRPVDLAQRINLCRTGHQEAAALPFDSRELLALEAFVAHQSKGMPIAVAEGPQTGPLIDAGRKIFERRMGQLNLSCAQCHNDNWGQRLGGAVIPQALPTGYPLYRLEWQNLGSLRRRLRNCMIGMRAEPFADDAPDTAALELYLAWRARGLPIETPAVRP
jgi:L-cysteine S-thiosulfotransferase